jgi:hypothetical protein
MRITVQVPESRDAAGPIDVTGPGATGGHGAAVACASRTFADRAGNPDCDPLRPGGHPPLGRYELVHHGQVPSGTEIEYGRFMLFFEPVAGAALEAQAFGRLLLPAYGGPTGADGAPRCTQGGLRLPDTLVGMVVAQRSRHPDTAVELVLEPLVPQSWWQFWKRAGAATPMSRDGPRLVTAPLDESGVARALLAGVTLRRRERLPHADDRDDDWRDRDRDRSMRQGDGDSRNGSHSSGGGSFAGAGASSGWEAPARPPGVDASGRIVAAAAGAAAGMALAAAAGDRPDPALDGGRASTASAGSDAGASASDTTGSTGY